MNYRADIDGIRAIAVTIVILFHFGVPGFTGGFIGVDVFFVLSGYLISSIIFSQLEKEKFSFTHFYFRRFRRLFPVYFVVMAVTFVAAYMLMLPKEFREFGQSLVASTAYVSNVLFFMEAGYFDTSSHLKPLLHTWSLSVEEQFYMVFPLVAWITARFSRRSWFILFGILTLASMIAAVLYIEQDTSAVFYLYPFRAWEMFFGTLLATSFIPLIPSRFWNNLAALLGLALIFVPNFIYDDKTLFPGINAIAPCLGTVLLIHTGAREGGWISQILSMKIPVFIGKISYSLYLWHWPIYVLYVYSSPEGTDVMDIWIMAIATFVASVISWRFVETAFREGKVKFSDRKLVVFGTTAAFSFVTMLIGYGIHKTNGLPQRLEGKTAEFAAAAADLFGDLSGCEEAGNSRFPNMGYCPIGDPFNSDSYTLIWGDSHGGAYKRGYSSFIEGKNQHALLAWDGGCPPIIGLNKDESVASKVIDERCAQRNRDVMDIIKEDKRINAIVLVGRWAYYINGGGTGTDSQYRIKVWPDGSDPDSISDQGEYFVSAFSETVKTLSDLGHKVFVVEQPPEFSKFRVRQLAIGLMKGSSDFDQDIKSLTVENYQAVLDRQGKMQAALQAAEDAGLATILKTHNYFCDGTSCSLMDGDAPTYFDNNHVSSSGAVKINTMFSPLLDYITHSQN